jgi:hypothetical protein
MIFIWGDYTDFNLISPIYERKPTKLLNGGALNEVAKKQAKPS